LIEELPSIAWVDGQSWGGLVVHNDETVYILDPDVVLSHQPNEQEGRCGMELEYILDTAALPPAEWRTIQTSSVVIAVRKAASNT
jgi:hypothetical protein